MALWLNSAVALAVAPFLSLYGYTIVYEDDVVNVEGADEVLSDASVNGWGVVSGVDEYDLIGQGPRLGVVLVLLAVALLVAVVARVLRRTEAWPARLGAFASAMTVAVGAVMIFDAEAQKSSERFDGLGYDVTLRVGLGLVFAAAVLAAVAVVIGLLADRDRAIDRDRAADPLPGPPTVPQE